MIEMGFLFLLAMMIFAGFLTLRSIKNFAINAVMGLIILLLANAVAGLGIGYGWLTILICGIGGVLGAVLVIILHLLGLGF